MVVVSVIFSGYRFPVASLLALSATSHLDSQSAVGAATSTSPDIQGDPEQGAWSSIAVVFTSLILSIVAVFVHFSGYRSLELSLHATGDLASSPLEIEIELTPVNLHTGSELVLTSECIQIGR